MDLKKILSKCKGMIIDGIAASEHIDSSGEILDVEGCDISDIHDGIATCNWEHQSESPTDTVGRIIYGKKIFKEEDCEDAKQLAYWKKSGVPLIYIIVELFDQDQHKGAQDLAAMIRHYHSRDLPILARYSIEGSTLSKKGQRLEQSILKRVSITLKPCNKDATSGVLFDPQGSKPKPKDDDIKSIVDKVDKFEHPTFTKLGGSVEIECMPLVEIKKSEAELTKDQIKEVLKNWDGEEDLKTYIRKAMPEVSEEFIDHFADAVEGFKIKIKKFEDLERSVSRLTKAVEAKVNPQPELESIQFGGKQIKPGTGTLSDVSNSFAPRSQIAIIGHEPISQSFVTIPKEKLSGWTDQDLKKLPINHPGLRIDTYPEEIDTSPVVDSNVHGVRLTPDAHALVHGMEMEPKDKLAIKHVGTNKKAFWSKTPSGKVVFVKPDYENDRFGDAEREGAFHNVAKSFFGLGHYIPTVATVRHPKTGQMHSVIEAVPGEHSNAYGTAPTKQEHTNTIKKLGDSGELDKLGLMDIILANPDRHHENYLFTPEGSIKLIDHGLSFGNTPYLPDVNPEYLSKYDAIRRIENRLDPKLQPVNPNTLKWLNTLDPIKFKRELRQNGVPLDYTNESVRRLVELKNHIAANPQTNQYDLHNSPFGGVKMVAEE